jgi:hypothetical protein
VLILLDNNAPRGLARALAGHTVIEARERGWATLKNGDLLTAAEEAGFEVPVTSDRNIRYQQNLEGRKIAICRIRKRALDPHQDEFVADSRGGQRSHTCQLY